MKERWWRIDGGAIFDPMRTPLHLTIASSLMLAHSGATSDSVPTQRTVAVATGVLPAQEARQAAAAEGPFVYAINNTAVAKYDRASGDRVAASTGEAKHLNSGFFHEGRLYCAHSNFPAQPSRSEIMVLDPETMELTVFKDFGEYRGSLTWAVREGDSWWCTFAHYGEDNARTVLVQLDDAWEERGAWTYPPEVVADLGRHSISGGFRVDGTILATGHDRRVIYRLRVPEQGEVLELIEVIPSPFPGQGIAPDPVTGGLVGIDRARKEIVFAVLEEEGDASGEKAAP